MDTGVSKLPKQWPGLCQQSCQAVFVPNHKSHVVLALPRLWPQIWDLAGEAAVGQWVRRLEGEMRTYTEDHMARLIK